MKKNKFIYFAALGLIASCASTQPDKALRSVASFNGYDGPAVDVNIINHPPPQYGYCDRYASQTAKHVLACSFGLDEASRMAERFGGGHGRLEGFYRGYSWGLYKTVDIYDSDEREMDNGARSVDSLGSYFASAQDAGKRDGKADAGSRGGADARERFYKAVDKGTGLPSAEVKVPAVTYTGERDAYAHYVGKIPTVQEILRQDSNLNEIKIYRSFDRTYLGEPRIMRTQDLWFEDGVYRFERERWYEPNAAFQTWLTIPLESKAKYQNLNVDVAIDSTTGKPVADFQAIFQDAFLQSYAYYVNYAFSKEFHVNLNEGQRQGEEVGIQIGKRIAFQRGLARAFDAKYLEVSRSSYQGAFSQAYGESFKSYYDYYKNNTVLDLAFQSVIEADRDGVVQPGEAFSTKFKVVNVGGVGSRLDYTVDGDVVEPLQFSDSIAPLSSKVITSKNIGRIDPRLNARDTARVVLKVNGLEDQYRQTVNRLLELTNYNGRVSVLDGSGQVQVALKNISQINVAGSITLELYIQGKLYKTVYGGKMSAGEEQSLVLDYKGLDPLFILMKGLQAEVHLKYNDVMFDKRAFSIGGFDQRTLVEYFDQLVNERGTVPEFTTLEDRIVEVKNIIIARNSDEVGRNRDSKGNVYRKTPDETLPGVIARIKDSRADHSTRAINEYVSMAEGFAKESKRFKSFLGIHPKRTAYMKIVSRIAGKELK